MTNLHINNATRSTAVMAFDSEQILRNVYAQSALQVAGRITSPKSFQLLSPDHAKLLRNVLANAYVCVCAPLAGYIHNIDIEHLEDGECTIELITNASNGKFCISVLRMMLEKAVALYVLAEVFRVEDGKMNLAETYRNDFNIQLRLITQYLAR